MRNSAGTKAKDLNPGAVTAVGRRVANRLVNAVATVRRVPARSSAIAERDLVGVARGAMIGASGSAANRLHRRRKSPSRFCQTRMVWNPLRAKSK